VGATSGRWESEWRLRWQYMIYGLHIPIWNRTKKPLAIAFSGVWRGLRGKDNGNNVTNVQYKSNQNCHYESPLHNEYILIKIYFKKLEQWELQRILSLIFSGRILKCVIISGRILKDWRDISVVKCLFSMCKVLSSIPSTAKKKMKILVVEYKVAS
jgi:hypothetical protein